MNRTTTVKLVGALALGLLTANSASAAPLYVQDFDVDDTANWNVNNNGAGTNAANFFFDYSTVGIPSAPHSTGGTTRGLKLGANLNSATAPASGNIPGISVSPTGKSFTGSYALRFDWWENYIGPLDVGATGSTMLAEFGIQTSGTTSNFPGTADSVFFAATGDGQSSADYRIYSPERPTSYDIFPASANPIDAHAVYPANSRNQSAALYMTTFPAGATAPGSQSSQPTQTSATIAGAAGFRWHDVVIRKFGNLVSWTVDGVLLGTVDETLFGTPTGGTNILFGHADSNLTTNSNATLLEQLQFTLIDNVQVIPEPGSAMLAALGACAACRRRHSHARQRR
jgi:hypothetical protein